MPIRVAEQGLILLFFLSSILQNPDGYPAPSSNVLGANFILIPTRGSS